MGRTMFSLRIDNEILNDIKLIAEKEYRTTGAQIEMILSEYLQKNQDTIKKYLDKK